MACIVAIVSVMLQHLQPLKLVNINKKKFWYFNRGFLFGRGIMLEIILGAQPPKQKYSNVC